MTLDNCQHVLLGCCTEAVDFLRQIGSLEHVRFHDRLNVIDGRNTLTIEASRLPAPLHLLPSIARSPFFSRRAKADLYMLMPALMLREAGKGETARDYMRGIGCTQELLERLVEPVVVSALNETSEQASGKYARMVLVESLLKSRRGYRLGVPTVPQSELIGKPGLAYLESRGCDVRLRCRVRSVRVRDGAVRWLELTSGERMEFDRYVAAVPPDALARMGVNTRGGERLGWRPIVSAHLIFDGQTPALEPACVVGQPFGWVFSKGPDVGYVEVVASAAGDLMDLGKDELLALARRAAATADRVLEDMPLRKGIVCRWRRAPFATLACDAHRPAAETPTSNLVLAGDWTGTDWPATIESAVRSGRAAASALLEAA